MCGREYIVDHEHELFIMEVHPSLLFDQCQGEFSTQQNI